MKKLKIKGGPIGYVERGKGPAVVLLQGPEDRAELLLQESRTLEKAGFRVIRLDLGPHLAGAASEQVVALLNHLGVGRAVFVARSRGGQVLQELVERFPRRVAKAIDLTRMCVPRWDAAGSYLVELLQGLRQGLQPALA
jgi:3-oxoadipate enol-lactonase